MAGFNAQIVFEALTSKAEQAVAKLERQVTRLQVAAEAAGSDRTFGQLRNSARRAQQQFRDLTQSVERFGKIGAAAGVGGLVTGINELAQATADGRISFDVWGKSVQAGIPGLQALSSAVHSVTGFLDPLNAALNALGPNGQAAAGGIALATTALLAFLPQVRGAAQSVYEAGGAFRQAAEAGADYALGIRQAFQTTQEYRNVIRTVTDNVSNLTTRQRAAQRALNNHNSTSEQAAAIARTLVSLTNRLNAEQERQNTLLRIATSQQREFNQQARVRATVAQSALERQSAGGGFAEFSRRATLGLAADDVAVEKAINRQRRKVEQAMGALQNKFGDAPLMLPSSEMLDAAGRGIRRLSNYYGDLNSDIDRGVVAGRAFTDQLNRQASKGQQLPPIFNQVERSLQAVSKGTQAGYQIQQSWNTALRQGNQWLAEAAEARAAGIREQQLELETERKINAEKAKKAELEAAAARSSKISGALGSALIGGGFPLLFGQGPAAAAGGALGGALGGLIGGQFGFALSIVGTAIGDTIQKAIDLENTVGSLNRSFVNTSSVTKVTATDIERLAASLGKTTDEALDLVATFSQFDTRTATQLASVFGKVGGADTFEAIARAAISEKDALQSIASLRKIIGNAAAIQLALDLKVVGAKATQEKLTKLIVDKQFQAALATARQLSFQNQVRVALAGSLALAIRLVQTLGKAKLPGLPALFETSQFGQRTLQQLEQVNPATIIAQQEKAVRNEMKAAQKALASETMFQGLANPPDTGDTGKGDNKAAEAAKRVAELNIEVKLAKDLLAIQKRLGEAQLNGVQSTQQALEIEQILVQKAAELAKIKASDATAAEKERQSKKLTLETDRQLLEASYQRQIAQQKLSDDFDKTILDKQNEVRLLQMEEGLKKELFRAELLINAAKENGAKLTEAQVKAYMDAVEAAWKLNGALNHNDQILQDTINGAGTQIAGLFDTLIQGTNDWNAVLTNTLRSLSSLLLKAGLSALGGGDNQGFFSILSGDFKMQPRANGGPVTSGRPYMVGEQGPELFVPGRSGAIVPNGAGGGVNSVVNVTINGDGTSSVDSGQGAELGRLINSSVTAILMRERRPGGMLAR